MLLYSAGIIKENPVKKKSENDSFLEKVSFSSDELTKEQRKMVLEYLEFLKTRK